MSALWTWLFVLALWSAVGLSYTNGNGHVPGNSPSAEWLPGNVPSPLARTAKTEAALRRRDGTRLRVEAPRWPLPSVSTAHVGDLDVRDLEERQTTPPLNEMALGPAFTMSNCIFCRDELGGLGDDADSEAILQYMNSEMFKSYMKGSQSQLRDKCVFYTKGVNGMSGLSVEATSFACSTRLRPFYSIWHLFPNSIDAGSNTGVRDFYCLWDDGDHWLAPVRDATNRFAQQGRQGASPAIRYFQQMSESMAKMCFGKVIIFTQTPTELADYAPGRKYEPNPTRNNIFWSHERPVLVEKQRNGEVQLLVVDISDTSRAREVTNTRTFSVGPPQPLSTWWKRDLEAATLEELWKRADLCATSGLGSQKPGMDYFG